MREKTDLEASDSSGSASLSDSFHRLTNSDSDWRELKVFVESGKKARVHGRDQEVEQEVVLVEDGALHVYARVEHSQHTSDRGRVHEESETWQEARRRKGK
jgi:hypothetical protein